MTGNQQSMSDHSRRMMTILIWTGFAVSLAGLIILIVVGSDDTYIQPWWFGLLVGLIAALMYALLMADEWLNGEQNERMLAELSVMSRKSDAINSWMTKHPNHADLLGDCPWFPLVNAVPDKPVLETADMVRALETIRTQEPDPEWSERKPNRLKDLLELVWTLVALAVLALVVLAYILVIGYGLVRIGIDLNVPGLLVNIMDSLERLMAWLDRWMS